MSVCQQKISIQNQSDLQNEQRCDKNEWGGGGQRLLSGSLRREIKNYKCKSMQKV